MEAGEGLRSPEKGDSCRGARQNNESYERAVIGALVWKQKLTEIHHGMEYHGDQNTAFCIVAEPDNYNSCWEHGEALPPDPR